MSFIETLACHLHKKEPSLILTQDQQQALRIYTEALLAEEIIPSKEIHECTLDAQNTLRQLTPNIKQFNKLIYRAECEASDRYDQLFTEGLIK